MIFWYEVSCKPLSLAQPVRDEPQPALAADLRVEQLERAGRRVPRVLERLLAFGPAQLVEPGELGIGHEDLAADLEQGRGTAVEHQGNLPDGAQVGRDVVAPLAVAAGGAQHELALLVAERDGHAVDLELDDVGDRLSRVQSPADPGIPLPDLVEAVGIVDREHGHRVRDGLELGQRRPADALRGAVGQ